MRMNWGYKLMYTFIVFACMMSYLVYRSFTTKFDLVDKEYYQSELKYQEVIDASANANALEWSPVLLQSGHTITLKMPAGLNGIVSGSIFFYCAGDAQKDKKIELKTDANGIQLITEQVTTGNYTVKIGWNTAGKYYYTEKKLIVL